MTAILAIFNALPILWRLVSIASVIAVIGGGVMAWNTHEFNKGWHAAVSAVAAKDKEALNAVKKAIETVDQCSGSGGTWDTVSGVCSQH